MSDTLPLCVVSFAAGVRLPVSGQRGPEAPTSASGRCGPGETSVPSMDTAPGRVAKMNCEKKRDLPRGPAGTEAARMRLLTLVRNSGTPS